MARVSDYNRGLIHQFTKLNMSLDHGGYYYARHGARGTAVAEVPFLGPYARTGGGAVGSRVQTDRT
jgi:hypothetical protein